MKLDFEFTLDFFIGHTVVVMLNMLLFKLKAGKVVDVVMRHLIRNNHLLI